MKQTFASNQFPHTSHSGLREQYARIAAGARNHQHCAQFSYPATHSQLMPVNIYQNNMSEFAYMLRLVKSLAETEKWITLIAPPSTFSLSLFAQAGIQVSKIRIAYPTAKHNAQQLMEKALQSDTSVTVIGFGDIAQFSDIAASGKTEQSIPVFVISGLTPHLH